MSHNTTTVDDPGQTKRALIDASAGAISGAVSRTVTSPLGVIKIRFQVQLEPTSSWSVVRGNLSEASKYTGMVQATKDIFREEGFRVDGRQYIVFPGRYIYTQRLKDANVDDKIVLNKVLLVGTKTHTYIG